MAKSIPVIGGISETLKSFGWMVKRAATAKTIRTELTCKNPPGEITEESMQTIQKAFSCERPVRVIVKGEEDLIVLPACIFAPKNSIVMYGQPNEGLVIIRVTPEIKAKVQKILDLMN